MKFCKVRTVFSIFAVLSGLGVAISFVPLISGMINNEDFDLKTGKKIMGIFLPIFIVLVLLICLLPSTKIALSMYYLPRIVNNEDIQQIPANAAKLLNEQLQEWLEDLEQFEEAP